NQKREAGQVEPSAAKTADIKVGHDSHAPVNKQKTAAAAEAHGVSGKLA
ncbi:hypothetical protein A2U01_0082790, partial [Trifolium medium]|nr:hypothetical protein [Trifolium medium]